MARHETEILSMRVPSEERRSILTSLSPALWAILGIIAATAPQHIPAVLHAFGGGSTGQ